MKEATLCFLINHKENKILLGMKKRGFGSGKYNGFGGKPNIGETIEDAAIRELAEESGVQIKKEQMKKHAELSFKFANKKEWDQTVHVFVSHTWTGSPIETDEMKPEWFATDKIPFAHMWEDDKHWLPLVLSGKFVKGEFTFEGDKMLDYKLS